MAGLGKDSGVLHPDEDDDDRSTALGAAPLIIRRVVRARVADEGGEAQRVAATVTERQAAEGARPCRERRGV